MIFRLSEHNITGLPFEDAKRLSELIDVYHKHLSKNKTKERYYEGRVTLGEVNLGLALPEGMRGLEIGCAWGAKTVDVLAARSMFDGFVGQSGADIAELEEVVLNNNLIAEYMKACRDELKFGCTFVT